MEKRKNNCVSLGKVNHSVTSHIRLWNTCQTADNF